MYQFVGGGGPGTGGGIGTIQPADGFQVVFEDRFTESATQSNSAVKSTYTNAAYSSRYQMYTLSCDKAHTVTTSGTAFTLSGTPGYTIAAGDIIYSGGNFRRIASISSQTVGVLDSAFPSNLAAAPCMVSQAVWTVDLANYTQSPGNDLTYNQIVGPANQTSVNLFYADSGTANDNYWDATDTAWVVVSGSNSGSYTDTSSYPNASTFAPVLYNLTTNIKTI